MDKAAIRKTLRQGLFDLNPRNVLPVNLHEVLARLRIGLHFEDTKGKGASYLQLGDSPTVIVNRPIPALFLSPRERFSIAHELAHWIVWRRFGLVPSSLSEYWFHEVLCNEFAAGLLIPFEALVRFLEQQSSEKVDPVFYPSKLAVKADVSWQVAAKSIAAYPMADSAYLRFAGASSPNSVSRYEPPTKLKVDCSTITNMPGSYVGRTATLRDQCELLGWMNGLVDRRLERRELTLTLGALHLRKVPCTFLKRAPFWFVHFSPSNDGVTVQAPDASQTSPIAIATFG